MISFKKILVALGLTSCVNNTYTQGVPNLYEVRPGLWRSGQPTTVEQWKYLYDLGIRNVIKLNFDHEGSDDGARSVGMNINVLSIEPSGDKDVISSITGTFIEPEERVIEEIQRLIENREGVLVHCTHGQDRTGLIIGISRIRVEKWSKEDAWKEMIAHGYHVQLLGLSTYWMTRVK